jgi:ABC-type transporter Mla maintaining outer membrane lipid asymmetry permease subunit MlaE
MLLWVVLREIGPLIAAVLVIQRSGTAVATELALMKISGEVASLRNMRIDPRDYLVVPRVVGIALANTALTVYVQFIAVGGGMLLSALVIDASLGEMAGSFFLLASPLDLVYSIAKSLLFGAAIGVIAVAAIQPARQSINASPRRRSARGAGGTAVMLLNVVFAYLVCGSPVQAVYRRLRGAALPVGLRAAYRGTPRRPPSCAWRQPRPGGAGGVCLLSGAQLKPRGMRG